MAQGILCQPGGCFGFVLPSSKIEKPSLLILTLRREGPGRNVGRPALKAKGRIVKPFDHPSIHVQARSDVP